MASTNTEYQREFKERKYKAGLKQMILWVKRGEGKQHVKMTRAEFLLSLKKLTEGWDENSLTELYCLFIKIIKGKKEAAKQKRKK